MKFCRLFRRRRDHAPDITPFTIAEQLIALEALLSAQIDTLMAQNAALSSAFESLANVMNQLLVERAAAQAPAATPEELQRLSEANAALLAKVQAIAATAAQAIITPASSAG